jgi:hypothetical protein
MGKKVKGILAVTGAGGNKTLKSADVDALGQFKGKIQKVIDDIDNPTDDTRGFGGDTRATQTKMAGKGSPTKKLTKREENALKRKKAADALKAKKKALKDAKKNDPSSLSFKGVKEGTSVATPNSVNVGERNRQKAILARKKKEANKKDNPDALETPGYLKTTDDTTKFDKQIGEAIDNMAAEFKREAAKRKKK